MDDTWLNHQLPYLIPLQAKTSLSDMQASKAILVALVAAMASLASGRILLQGECLPAPKFHP